MQNPQDRRRLQQAVVQRLENLRGFGVEQIPRPAPMPPLAEVPLPSPTEMIVEPEPAPPPETPVVAAIEPPSPIEETAPMSSLTDRKSALEVLQQEVAACTQCSELASTRTQTVFGVGTPKARVCFFGEAPGADEDRLGEPFVGRAGKLLTKIIEACSFRREDVYILNVLKCRPPGNRNPSPDEVTNCRRFFERQLDIIQPEYLCCLGAVAAQNLLDTTEPIGKLRGEFHQWRGIKVLATYHPAYLLRNPPAKRDVWDDMKILMHDMGLKIPEQYA